MKNHIMLPAKKISLSLLLSLLSSILVHSQTALPISYSPDGPISSIITKGDTLIVGGDFRHVGKYTGGGALLSPNSDDPILSFPKINGTILSSSPDGNGGFYVYGSFYKESENPSLAHSRIEHILADYTFEANFSIAAGSFIRDMLFHNGILYIGSYNNSSIEGQAVGRLCGIDVVSKTLVSWIPSITRTSGSFLEVNRIKANGNNLYIIGSFQFVGGIERKDAASIEIGTGTVRAWNPTPNWVNYQGYNDLVFYNDKVIIGGGFNNNGQLSNGYKHACAIVDTLSGQNFSYLFASGGLFGNNGGYLYWAAGVERLQIKDNILYAFTNGTYDTRVTAINLNTVNLDNPNLPYVSGQLWVKYFNMIALPKDMVIIDNSLFLMGSNFEKVYVTNQVNDEQFLERKIIGGAKLDIATGNLQSWFPDPVDKIYNIIWTISASNNKILIGGQFTHLNGVERNGVYMYNTTNETVLPFKIDFYLNSPIYSMKLSGNNLYLGGRLSWQAHADYSILGFNVNNGNILNWYPPKLGSIGYIDAIEVNNQYVFVGGRYLEEPSGGLGRINLFAIDKSTGALNSWSPNPNFQVNTLHLSYNQLYVGGDFTNIAGQSRNQVASFDISNLSLTNWNPNTNGRVYSIHPKSGSIWLGGNFSSVNNNTSYNIVSVNSTTGANIINSNTILFGSPISTLSSKGCKLFVGGDIQRSYTSNCFNLMEFDLNTNSFTPDNSFCISIGTSLSNNVRVSTILGNDLYFAGTFTKINNDTKNTNIGRIRFPTNYFTPCEIANCGNEISLTSTADDLNTGSYTQKSNLNISATNKILGNAQVTLKSNSSVLLLPNTNTSTGFLVKPSIGGSFKAEIGPCN